MVFGSGDVLEPHEPSSSVLTNTRNTPVEALERVYPLRVRRLELRRGSGGDGVAAGGEGIVREIEVLENVTVSVISERRVSAPWGAAGGTPGASGQNWTLRGGDPSRAERLADKCTVRLEAGDILRVLTPGGGGWAGPNPDLTGRDFHLKVGGDGFVC